MGLRLLLGEGSILKCHADALDARWHAEMGASATVLDAGYNIASLQKRCTRSPSQNLDIPREVCMHCLAFQ